ncbi:hypothetical protein FOQG_18861 [Fusarium oxysporum f. sp. raphani 54005]|uniref:Uncharacterized protein n=1 Tax=Fusarium oxysporum f. sp. raphani 54005 TaxID=1089458 RepID=X0BC48_FUSOX|nr:hypothetical protein FOQG_18861 [Fusarium oxysporum f. sp. raphani 54005]
MRIISPRYLQAICNGGIRALKEQLEGAEEHPLAISTYTDGYEHGNTTKEQLDNLKAYLNSAFNQISELDKIQEESLQSIVDEWHRLNEYSIVAVFDCVWTGLGRMKILMRRAQVIMSTINPQSLIEIRRLTLTVDEKGSLLHYDTHDRRLLIRVANSASSSARQNKETGSSELRMIFQEGGNTTAKPGIITNSRLLH